MEQLPFVDQIPIPAFLILTVVLNLIAVESGLWFGRRRSERELESTVGATVGATLGLLAFTLAFTFGMAADRYNARKALVLEEANAIGTTYLRAGLLPAPHAATVRTLLRKYVDARLQAVNHPDFLGVALSRSEQLQSLLWQQATEVGTAQSNSETVALFIESLNDVIDLHAKRLAGWRNRIPGTIWFFVFLTAVLGMFCLGYQAGLTKSRRTVAIVFLTIAFSGVITLISDLDRPQEGLLKVSQQAMLDLQKSLND